MNTLTRSNAAVELGKRDKVDLEFLAALFESPGYTSGTEAQRADVITLAVQKVNDLKPSPARNAMATLIAKEGLRIKSQSETSHPSKPRESAGLDLLAKQYIAQAISGMTRMPSANMKNSTFKTTILHWRALLIAALRTEDEPTAFVNAMLAIVSTEGQFEALRFVRNLGGQILWQASVDIARARRTQSEVEETQSSYVDDGMGDHEDSDTVRAVTEDEARDSYLEAHGWLSAIADQIATESEERERLGLADGLEFVQIRQQDEHLGETWVRVYDVDEAIDWRIDQNVEALKRRDGAKVVARKDAFKALAALAAA